MRLMSETEVSQGMMRHINSAIYWCYEAKGKVVFLIKDSISMIRDIRAQGGVIGNWGGLLNIPQMIGGLIFIRTIEGIAILVTVVLTLFIAGQIHRNAPFSRAVGLCHIPWLALLPWLVFRLANYEYSAFQTGWLNYVVITISISLVFDVADVVRFLRGDRKFAWANDG